MLDRRAFIAASGAAPFAGCATGGAEKKPPSLIVDLDRTPDFEFEIWPNGAPGGENVSINEHYVERENPYGLPDRAAHDVTHPTLTVFRARNPNGSAILIIPGGGYSWVVVEKEGYEGARLFSREGATVYVLKYRLPHQGWAAGPDTPLQDAQRAMRIIRARAAEDGVDPERVMVMGFSAGGHLGGSLATRFDAQVYESADDADAFSARPDLATLVYPVATMNAAHAHMGSRTNLIGPDASDSLIAKYSLETAPPQMTPPVFLLHAADDLAVPVENSLFLFQALKAAGVSAAMHIFEEGGHGFGVRGIDDKPLRYWPELVMAWARNSAVPWG